MTTYYYVGTGNWTDSARWSLTSGGTGGAGIPGPGDTARFDANSGTSVTLTTSVTVGNLDATGWGTYALSRRIYFNNYTISINGYGANALLIPATVGIEGPSYSGTSPTIYLTNATSNAVTVRCYMLSQLGNIAANLVCAQGNFPVGIEGNFNNLDFWANGTSTYSGEFTCNDILFYGRLSMNTVASGMTTGAWTGAAFYPSGSNSEVLSNGQAIVGGFYLNQYYQGTPALTLLDACTTTWAGISSYDSCTVNFNGKNYTGPGLYLIASGQTFTVTFGSGNPTLALDTFGLGSATCTGQGTALVAFVGTGSSCSCTVTPATATVPVTLSQAGSKVLTVSGGAYLNIKNTGYGTVKFTGPVRFVDVNLKGTAGTPLVVQGTAASTAVSKVDPWYVGPNSTDAGGNTGILFSGNEGSDYLTVSNLSGTYNYGPHFMAFM